MSILNEINKQIKKTQQKRKKQSESSRSRTPLFAKQDRMEQAYKKHLERLKNGSKKEKETPNDFNSSFSRKNSNKVKALKSKVSQKSRRQKYDSFLNNAYNDSLKTVDPSENALRNFTSFGSKVATTPSTSKRSSNEVENEKQKHLEVKGKNSNGSENFNKGKINLLNL